jgi:choline kinase
LEKRNKDMKVIILAAGQGTRLRPLTDDRPKCMVWVNGRSIIEIQLDTMHKCGITDGDITIVTGYRSDVLINKFKDTPISFIVNKEYETTNMVCSLMCAGSLMESEDDIIISYGDIIYNETVFNKILGAKDEMSVIVDDGWYEYWSERCENPLDDAETLMFDKDSYLTEIGQKTTELSKVQSQYIGLMRFKGQGLEAVLNLAKEAKRRSDNGEPLWRTDRNYSKMYMTDLLQGLIDEGNKLRAVHIQRGWFEIDNCDDLKVVESKIK